VILLILCANNIVHYKGYTASNQQLEDASVVANWTLFRDYEISRGLSASFNCVKFPSRTRIRLCLLLSTRQSPKAKLSCWIEWSIWSLVERLLSNRRLDSCGASLVQPIMTSPNARFP